MTIEKIDIYQKFEIASVSRTDIINAFEEPMVKQRVQERVSKMNNSEMIEFSYQMYKIYRTTLYWDSIRKIFMNNYMAPRTEEPK